MHTVRKIHKRRKDRNLFDGAEVFDEVGMMLGGAGDEFADTLDSEWRAREGIEQSLDAVVVSLRCLE